ncbi:MAG: N-6 DNA methylase [Candidatus Cloacimonadales bacterium]
MSKLNINERSWAIDVISEVNRFLSNKSWTISAAGGENSLSFDKRTLFPDLLLFKDKNKSCILHGWELKMPDTSIDDKEFIHNAKLKATILGKNSFLLWNVTISKLYVKENDDFKVVKTWELSGIKSRNDVQTKGDLWKKLLHEIIEYLNNYFLANIDSKQNDSFFSIDQVFDIVLNNAFETKLILKQNIKKNNVLEAEINAWWRNTATEYGFKFDNFEDKLNSLSKIILTDWVIKIIFANMIKRYHNDALKIETINEGTSINEALQIVIDISNNCNFWNIFKPHFAQLLIDEESWCKLKQLNSFLSSINVKSIDSKVIKSLLEDSIQVSKRKVLGQFTTPNKLAELLIRVTMTDKNLIAMDPCCGTGTIVKEVMNIKREYDISESKIIESSWASDKHSFPIQLSTLSLTNLDHYGHVLNIHTCDVFDLETNNSIDFRNPYNGNIIAKSLPKIDYIISNLPFIDSSNLRSYKHNIIKTEEYISETLKKEFIFNKRSDFFVYIPFILHKLLSKNGRIGLILSNAWLGTEYGKEFVELLQQFYTLDSVFISGNGRWFYNADVVTSIIVATKKETVAISPETENISFCALMTPINDCDDIKQISEKILLNQSCREVKIINRNISSIKELEKCGFSWSSFFVDLDWHQELSSKLIKANELFSIFRGERRGWNELFYPHDNSNIEAENLMPLVKNLRNTKNLLCIPNKIAFCCTLPIEKLKNRNFIHTLAWIDKFYNSTNGSGELLRDVLKSSSLDWYQMSPSNSADYVCNINFADSLFIAYLPEKAIIDQRMIGFSLKSNASDKDKLLLLALLNSTISMFFIESSGFGRGLGALDLNSNKIKDNFKILNPNLLSDKVKKDILKSFTPLLKRNRKPLLEELSSPDRLHFEKTIIKAFQISESSYSSIEQSLRDLYAIRNVN